MSDVQVFDTPGSVALAIRIPAGRVSVTTADEPTTTVEILAMGRRGDETKEAIEVRAEERRGGHQITIEQKEKLRWGPLQISWGGDIEIRVTCPPGSDLEFSSGSADLRVDGDLGEVSVNTASGDVELGDVARRLRVKTASGDVVADTAASGGEVSTVSGDLALGSLGGDFVARSVSGDVRLGAVSNPTQVSTTSGDVVVTSIEGGELRVQTVSGDVRVGVGRGTRVFIDAVSVSGDLGSELGLGDAPPQDETDASSPVVPLHLKTVSGDVQIVRSAEAFSA